MWDMGNKDEHYRLWEILKNWPSSAVWGIPYCPLLLANRVSDITIRILPALWKNLLAIFFFFGGGGLV